MVNILSDSPQLYLNRKLNMEQDPFFTKKIGYEHIKIC